MNSSCTLRLVVFVLCVIVAMTTKSSYKVAVYEHVLISPDDPEGNFTREEAFGWMKKNLDIYEEQSRAASQMGADMIVFPEYGITGFDQSRESFVPFLEDIPDPENVDWTPCEDPTRYPNTKVLHTLSCMAISNDIYVVANMGDYKKCNVKTPSCPPDERYQFNTNVVFDNKGKLTARYHKFNLYDESPLFDAAPTPEYVTFNTTFGRFGTVVCFDLMHMYPTQKLLQDYHVDNLLVTSAWNVFDPFPFSTQMYSGISKMNKINVIASNARNAMYKMASSGIFGPGIQSVISDPDFNSDNGVLLLSELQSDTRTQIRTPEVRNVSPLYDTVNDLPYRNKSHTATYDYGMDMSYVVLSYNSSEAIVCHNTVCCAVKYKMKDKTKELYIIAASEFSMERPGKAHFQLCAVHRCRDHTHETCGGIVEHALTSFEYLKIQAFLDIGLVLPLVATSPYNNQTIDTEKDDYQFDQKSAVFESSSLRYPILSVVVFNSVNQSLTLPNIKTGESLSMGLRPTSHKLIVHSMFTLVMVSVL